MAVEVLNPQIPQKALNLKKLPPPPLLEMIWRPLPPPKLHVSSGYVPTPFLASRPLTTVKSQHCQLGTCLHLQSSQNSKNKQDHFLGGLQKSMPILKVKRMQG